MEITVEKILTLMSENADTAYKIEKELGLASGIFQKWKNGKSSPSPEAIIKLSQHFGVSTDYIFGLTNKKASATNANEYNLPLTIERVLELLNTTNEATYKVEKNAGLSNASFQAWKNGRSKPSSDSIVKLAKYFNVTTDYLLGLSDSPSSEVMPQAVQPAQTSNLTPQEIEMLTLFRQLTAIQQGKVLGYTESFLKNSQSDVG